MIFHKRAFVSSLVLSLLSIASASATDTILLHGHIYADNPKVPWAQAMAIAATRIEAIGSDQEIAPLQKPGTTVIDLHGGTVIPGISDSHTHMWFGSIRFAWRQSLYAGSQRHSRQSRVLDSPTATFPVFEDAYGMPILDVDKARTVMVIKRSMAAGFAGIENPLYYLDRTLMLFGDAKTFVGNIVRDLSGGGHG